MLSSRADTAWPQMPEPRPVDYRRFAAGGGLRRFNVRVEHTDLMIAAEKLLIDEALQSVHRYRGEIKGYIRKHPDFQTALTPLAVDRAAPPIVRAMADAARRAGVGPMASVAGAIAEFVGCDLVKESPEIIVENGGDIFCQSAAPRSFLLLAEQSQFGALRVRFAREGKPFGVCTSAGTCGPSLSFGRADAMMVAADDTALADAIATALGNRAQDAADLQDCVNAAQSLGAFAAIAVMGDRLAAWGAVELEPDA